MLEVYIDGACQPVNPGGTCSYGLVIKREHEYLLKEAEVIGCGELMSNNVGEYAAMQSFLKWYLKFGDAEEAIIKSDSQLLVNQLVGVWKVRDGLYIPYYLDIQNILKRNCLTNRFKYKWIPREENLEADNLSKTAIILNNISKDRQVKID